MTKMIETHKNSMKKILFLTPFAPSNRAGGENFTRLLLENLSAEYKVDLIYYRYVDDPRYVCPNENVRVIKELINSTFVKLKNWLCYPSVHPIFAIRFDSSVLSLVKQMINENKYDLLYLDHSQMALYGKYFPEMKKILMSHDVMAQRFSRSGSWFSKKLIIADEKKMMTIPNTIVFSFSDKDRKIIKDTYGIDSRVTNFFLDESLVKALPEKIEKRVIFFGKWKRLDNFDGLQWFFQNVYDKMDKSIKISIIGKWLPEQFQDEIKSFENVEYLGFIENPYPLIANSIATLSPLFSGAGVKVKVVESLACGTPVIGTGIAFEGLPEKYSNMMLLANDVDSYLKAMEVVIPVEERRKIKKDFIADYTSETIPQFLNKLLNK